MLKLYSVNIKLVFCLIYLSSILTYFKIQFEQLILQPIMDYIREDNIKAAEFN